MAFNIVRYSQQDPQWKNEKIGGGPDTIGYIGCALTSTAMLVSGWGYLENPSSLNKKLTANGGFINEAIVWSKVSAIYPQVQSTGLTICLSSDAPLAQIDAALGAGQPVIVEVDFSPEAGLQTHWVVVYAKQANDYLILDPWPNPSDTNQVTLMSRFSQGKPLQRAIKAVAWYHCSAGASVPPATPPGGSTPPSPTLPPPVQTDLVVQVVAAATAGLRLHTQPSQDSVANYAEMPGTKLQVIEDKAGALAKIGINDQWIYVRDSQGNQGYVAAWLVQEVTAPSPSTPPPGPAPTPSTPPATPPSTPPTTTPPPASGPKRFQVTVGPSVGAGGLRLRKEPSMAGALLAIEKSGGTLTVLEPPGVAQPKIGVAGQWISVRDNNGLRGYVAAQYVQLAP
jgi:Peptidase_C39 like family